MARRTPARTPASTAQPAVAPTVLPPVTGYDDITGQPLLGNPEPISPRDQRLAWYCFLSGAIIYSVYFIIVYLVTEWACALGRLDVQVGRLNGVSLFVLVATVIAAAGTATGAVVAWRTWRRLHTDGAHVRVERSVPLLAYAGIWLNAFFTLITVLTALPGLFLVACDWI